MKDSMTGAEAAVRILEAHGVEFIFGLCGDTSLPFYDALARLDHRIKHILCRDERSAAYMADAYARVTGKVGVCEGPSGGGATYLLPGLVEANESSVPVLGITTDIGVASRGRYTLTELDQRSLFRPLTKWNDVIERAADVPRMFRKAFVEMTTGRPGAAHLGFPFDVQEDAVSVDEVWADLSLGEYPARRTSPDPAVVEEAARLLAAARQPVVVCGGGVVLAGAEAGLRELAESIDAPVATTISGQGSIPDSHPLAVGVVGSNGGVIETRGIVDEADLVLFIGCRAGSVTTERWRYPSSRARILHIDVDPTVIGANYRTDVALVGDAKLSLAALNKAVSALPQALKNSEATSERVKAACAAKHNRFQELAVSDDVPIKPERLVADLDAVLPEGAVVVADPGTPCPYLSAYLPVRNTGRSFITNRAHGALGYAFSAAVGAQFGRPGAKCVSIMGDGSFGFTIGEMETVTRYRLPITFVVVSNSVYGWIKAGQKAGFGERYFSVDFSTSDHACVAAGYGIRTWRVDSPHNLKTALAEAIAHDGPSLVDVVCQPLHEAAAPVSEWVA